MSKQQITNKLMEVYEPAEVRAGQVYKGHDYDGSIEATGWWYRPFNAQPIFLGTSKSEAFEIIDDIGSSRENW